MADKGQQAELVKPSLEYKGSFLEAEKEYQAEGRHLDSNVRTLNEDFEKFLERLNDEAKGIGMKEGYVPMTTLWLVENDEFIGHAAIRHYLNENLLRWGGNIGYAVRPSKRSKGYGTKILGLALSVAKGMGIDRALVTCDDSNIGSARVIENNGGVLENKIEYEGKIKRRYWIENK